MANLHKIFIGFNEKLELTPTKLSYLKTSEQNIKKYIKQHFKEKYPELTFNLVRQGSYSLGTMIRTCNDYCDVDFGLRFFPFPKKLQPITLQKYVAEALYYVKSNTPIHKKKCIRLNYRGNYHIDVTLYGLENFSGSPKLATKDGWEDSDPSKFKKWFEDSGGKKLSQMKRVVKYLKAWSDYKGKGILKGVVITVLVGQHFVPDKRDDISLKQTTIQILNHLRDNWSCEMPVSPFDDLIENMSQTSSIEVESRLNSLIHDAEIAIAKNTNEEKAIYLWKKHLGKYF